MCLVILKCISEEVLVEEVLDDTDDECGLWATDGLCEVFWDDMMDLDWGRMGYRMGIDVCSEDDFVKCLE